MTRNPFDSDDPRLFDVSTRAPGPKGSLPLTAADAARAAVRRSVRMDAERRHGMESVGARRQRISDALDARRHSRGGWHADRARLSHRTLGSRVAARSRGGRVQRRRRHSVCGGVHRSVRRPIAGHDGDVRQPAVPKRRGHGLPPADSIAADAPRCARRRDVRQGPARDDDGARGEPRSACGAGAGRRHACCRSRARTPARFRRSACDSCTAQ